MSYIGEALKRAWTASEDRYIPYRDLLASRSRHGSRGRKSMILGVSLASLVILASTAFSLILYLSQEPADIREEGTDALLVPAVHRARIDAATRQPSPLASVTPTGDADILFLAGLRRQQAGDLADAEALYRKALEANPENLSALNNLGVLCMAQKRDKEATDIFNRLIDAKAGWADPYYNLACLYGRQGNVRKSLWYLRVALWMDKPLKEWARNDPDLEPLRARPEYNKIVN